MSVRVVCIRIKRERERERERERGREKETDINEKNNFPIFDNHEAITIC
jgi:ribose 1,5-bisphosphokinase PhnN